MSRLISITFDDLCYDGEPPPPPPKPRRSPREPHIDRHPLGGSWVVSANLGDRVIELEFADEFFGGRKYALDAARSWRDAQPWYEAAWGASPSVNPIRRYECHAPGSGSVDAVWYASGVDIDGSKWIRKFSVAFWGEERAMHKAMYVRDLQLNMMASGEPRVRAPRAAARA